MKRWEYKIVDSRQVPGETGLFKGRDPSDVEAHLNQLGRDGWELVNIDFRELESRMEFTGVARREIPG